MCCFFVDTQIRKSKVIKIDIIDPHPLPSSSSNSNGNYTTTIISKPLNNFSDWDDPPTASSHHRPEVFQRLQPPATSHRYREEVVPTPSAEKVVVATRQQLPQVPSNTTSKVNALNKHVQRHYDIDENEAYQPTESGQFSTNIAYVQLTQRRTNHLKEVPQSNSFEMSHSRHHYPSSYANGLSPSRTDSSPHRSTSKAMPTTYQPSPIRRQQSLSYDKTGNTTTHIVSAPLGSQRLIDSNAINRRSTNGSTRN